MDLRLGVAEAKFADIIWSNEPISSSELARISERVLNWKKTTSFTVLKRLSNKGIFKNTKGTVTSLVSKDEFYSMQSEKFVQDTFDGSLPAFITAFTSRKKLSSAELSELQKILNELSQIEN